MPTQRRSTRKKLCVVSARVDSVLLARMELAAEERGLSVSEWLRDVATEAVGRPRISAAERLLLERLTAVEIALYEHAREARGDEFAARLWAAVDASAADRAADFETVLRRR